MKRFNFKLMIASAFAMIGMSAYAEDGITCGTLSVSKGESAYLDVYYTAENYDYSALVFTINLPTGLSVDTDETTGKTRTVTASSYTGGDLNAFTALGRYNTSNGNVNFTVEANALGGKLFTQKSGKLLTLKVNAGDISGLVNVTVTLKSISAGTSEITTNVNKEVQPVAAAVGGAPVKIASSGYTIICYENALDFSSVSEVTAVYAVSKASSTSASLKEIESKKVPANTGVIVEGTAGSSVFVPFAEGSVDAVSPNVLVGVNEAKALAADEGYILIGGKFLICEAGTLPAHKAYLPASALTAKATELVFDFDTVVTGINEVKADSADNSPVYNLNGARVSNLQKGVYVKNGRKFIVK